eukprot:6545223-Alexandrium_andersonii.AAC.1
MQLKKAVGLSTRALKNSHARNHMDSKRAAERKEKLEKMGAEKQKKLEAERIMRQQKALCAPGPLFDIDLSSTSVLREFPKFNFQKDLQAKLASRELAWGEPWTVPRCEQLESIVAGGTGATKAAANAIRTWTSES